MELKPCPFCGANEDSIRDLQYYLPYCRGVGVNVISIIYCTECGGALIDQNKNHCYNDRVAAWNRRAQITEVRQYGANPTNITNLGELNLNL